MYQPEETKVGQSKGVIWVPSWIAEILERQNQPVSKLLDYNVVQQYLSIEEQVLLVSLQNYELERGEFDKDGLPVPGWAVQADNDVTEYAYVKGIVERWKASVIGNKEAGAKALNCINNAIYMTTLGEYNTLKARLFSPDSREDAHEKPFITYDITDDVVIVVVYPGYFNQKVFPSFKFDLLKAILKVLYVYNTHAKVCKSPYFQKYLSELGQQCSS